MLRLRSGRIIVNTQSSELGFDSRNNSRIEGLFVSWLFDTEIC